MKIPDKISMTLQRTALLLLCAWTMAACLGMPGTTPCDNGTGCPVGYECSPDGCIQPDVCGNGKLEAGEQCDDGNLAAGDGCTSSCQSEICGNGIADPGEECDCGDGSAAPADASCEGRENSTLGGYCRADCRLHCGDGEVAEAEACDTAAPITQSCLELRYDFGQLACSASCDAFVATDCGLWGWEPMVSPTSQSLFSVWGSGPDNVFAVGDYGTVLH